MLVVFPIERLPRVRAIEESNSHIADDLRVEVPDIHAHPLVFGIEGFPVGCAAAGTAADCAQCLVALNVFGGVLRVAMNLDGANLVVGPERAQSSTNGAIAIGDLSWTTGNLNLYSTAMTRGFEHVRHRLGIDEERGNQLLRVTPFEMSGQAT